MCLFCVLYFCSLHFLMRAPLKLSIRSQDLMSVLRASYTRSQSFPIYPLLRVLLYIRRYSKLRGKMSCSHDASGPGWLAPVDPRCGLPELQMISNRIARNIIRYVFHYLTGASRFKLDYRQVRRSRSYIFLHTHTDTRAKGEEGRRQPYGGALTEGTMNAADRYTRGGASRRERRGSRVVRGFPQVPYNTVASRIRNLLLIIMLSILTRHSYFSPAPVPLISLFPAP